MSLDFILQYVVFGVVFGALDAVWLVWAAKKFYHKEIGSLLAKKPDMRYAAVFYLLYVLGVTQFVIQRAAIDAWPVFASGVLFGAVAYGTYDLTNQATLKKWSQRVVIADIAWGAFATGTAAYLTMLITPLIRGS